MISSAPAKILTVFLALAFVLTPAICCCFGLGGQAMAAPVVEMAEEDCHGHESGDMAAGDHQNSSDPVETCHDQECSDCTFAGAIDDVTNDRFVVAASTGVDTLTAIENSETTITPIASLVASTYPHRGPPPLLRTSLLALHVLLLN